MHATDAHYQALTQGINAQLSTLRGQAPAAMQGFSALARGAMAPGVLDAGTKELIAMAIAVAGRCDDCIGFHGKALVSLGVTDEALAEMLSVAVYMGGGPSLMYAAHAMQAVAEFRQAAAS